MEERRIFVTFDAQTGYTDAIIDPMDLTGLNWVLENGDWGRVDGFTVQSVTPHENGLSVSAMDTDGQITLHIEKHIESGVYTEAYTLTNHGASDYEITHERFGIHFPFQCLFDKRPQMHDVSCNTHIWCGGAVTWLYAAKPSGYARRLVGCATAGEFDAFSLDYDVSRVTCGAFYRGAPILHPVEQILAPGATTRFAFAFCFSEQTPDSAELCDFLPMSFTADRYSLLMGETAVCTLLLRNKAADVRLLCNGVPLLYTQDGNRICAHFTPHSYGEQIIEAIVDGRRTWLKLNVLHTPEALLRSRAEFIVRKQQVHAPNTALDGAFLIYDRATDALVYEEAFADHNACRERISMGVVLAVAMQKAPTESGMAALRAHRAFIEREIFDTDSATVYDAIGERTRQRAYNYPWLSVYYLEWYRLTQDAGCLVYAARILLAYYEKVHGGNQESPFLCNAEICDCLAAENLTDLRAQLLAHTLEHAKTVLQNANHCHSFEVSCTQFMFAGKINILLMAYRLTGDKAYLQPIPAYLKRVATFCAAQPDYHTNGIALRYWDLYWFGKSRTYGDTMPQWLSALPAETYLHAAEAGFGAEYREMGIRLLRNNLCVFGTDGFASCGYLVPWRVRQFGYDAQKGNPHMVNKTTYGQIFDDYANDQDWALYLAVKYLG